jgi:hypothetical protein
MPRLTTRRPRTRLKRSNGSNVPRGSYEAGPCADRDERQPIRARVWAPCLAGIDPDAAHNLAALAQRVAPSGGETRRARSRSPLVGVPRTRSDPASPGRRRFLLSRRSSDASATSGRRSRLRYRTHAATRSTPPTWVQARARMRSSVAAGASSPAPSTDAWRLLAGRSSPPS